MEHSEFEKLLKKADLNKKEFARLVKMNYNSITNWKQGEAVPDWVKSWLDNYIKAKTLDKVVDAIKPFT